MSAPTSSFDLVEKVKGGDRNAFSRLFEKYRRRLAVLIYYKLGADLRATCEVDDILQETLLRAFRDIGQFHYRTPGSFLSWCQGKVETSASQQSRKFRFSEVAPNLRDKVDAVRAGSRPQRKPKAEATGLAP